MRLTIDTLKNHFTTNGYLQVKQTQFIVSWISNSNGNTFNQIPHGIIIILNVFALELENMSFTYTSNICDDEPQVKVKVIKSVYYIQMHYINSVWIYAIT